MTPPSLRRLVTPSPPRRERVPRGSNYSAMRELFGDNDVPVVQSQKTDEMNAKMLRIMNKIDDIKESISEGDYLEIVEELKGVWDLNNK
tara:strand:- start:807 stop:1073 length:267 start_codon:yes stop_codon:yes gene_type:complete